MDDQQIAERVTAAELSTGKKLSLRQQAFVYTVLNDPKIDHGEAALMAGYSSAASGLSLLRGSSVVGLAIRADVIGQFQHLAALAVNHYREVLTNPKASDTAKNQASEAILNRAGILQAKPSLDGDNDKENKALEDLSTAELEAMIKGLETTKAKRVEASDAEVIDVTPIESIG